MIFQSITGFEEAKINELFRLISLRCRLQACKISERSFTESFEIVEIVKLLIGIKT